MIEHLLLQQASDPGFYPQHRMKGGREKGEEVKERNSASPGAGD